MPHGQARGGVLKNTLAIRAAMHQRGQHGSQMRLRDLAVASDGMPRSMKPAMPHMKKFLK